MRGRLAEVLSSPKVTTARLLPQVDRSLTGWLCVLVLIGGTAPLAIVVVAGVLVGAVPEAVPGGLDSAAGHRAVTSLVALGALFALVQVASAARVAVADALGLALERHLEQRVMRAAMAPHGLGHLEDPSTLDQIAGARTVGSAGYRIGEAVAAMASRSVTRISGYGAAALLAGFRWWVAVVMAGAWGWAGREQRRSVLETTKTLSRQNALVRRAEYFRTLAVTPGAAKELRVFALGPWLVDRFRNEMANMLSDVWRERARLRWQWAAATLAASCASLAVLVLLGRAAVDGDIDLDRLGLFTGAVLAVMALVHMGPDNHRIAYGTPAVPAVLAVERLTARTGDRAGDGQALPAGAPTEAIRFEGVTFRYPGASRHAVHDLDLVIRAGCSTAIVGVNGAGKTTLVKLLCRFYDPDAGRITVDGWDMADVDPRAWQRGIAALFQDFVHYPMTAAENISFGAVRRPPDRDAIAAAARRAGALPFIETLPGGFDTPLAATRSGGVDLSGGQWQRVALARALYAVGGGARVLVLDEPAANLDVRAEADLYDRFLDLTEGLTTVVISHRFSTVRRADRIVVVDGGRVVEEGGHDELVDFGGLYARMFRVQVERLASDPDG